MKDKTKHNFRRNPMLQALLMLALTLGLGACGSRESTALGDLLPEDSSKSNRLTVYTWGDYFAPPVLERFTRETGIEIDYQTFENTADLIGQVRSDPGRYDIVIADDSVVASMRDLSLLSPIDMTLIPNAKHLDPKFLGLPFDSRNEVSLPYAWGTTLITYRSDKVEEPVHSWSLLWDERYKGKIIILDEGYEALGMALLRRGFDLNTEKTEEIEQARKDLLEIFSRQEARMGDYEKVRAELRAGTCWVAMNYSGDAAIDAENIPHVDFFVPEEGAPLWVDNFAITRDSRNREVAHRFINYLLEPKQAAENTNFTYYSTPVKTALPHVDPEIAADERIFLPKEVLDRSAFYAPGQAERNSLINTVMTEMHKIAAGRNEATSAASTDVEQGTEEAPSEP